MKTVVVYSGGLDSTALLLDTKFKVQLHRTCDANNPECDEVLALSFNYGQRHSKELQVAATICDTLSIPHKVFDISALYQLCESPLMKTSTGSIPQKAYAKHNDQERDRFGSVVTSIPARNLQFGLAAAIYAALIGYNRVVLAVHKTDGAYYAYPDCTPAALYPLISAIKVALGNQVKVEFPFINIEKFEILNQMKMWDAPQVMQCLTDSWSCYAGGKVHCGRCATCLERKEAFKRAGVADQTVYEK